MATISVVAACSSGGRGPPSELIDGSPARVVQIEFEGVDVPVIETVAQARPDARLPCGDALGSLGRGIERVGAMGSSVTILSAGRTVLGCDGIHGGDWCGQAFGRLRPRRILDPRLSLTCSAADGSPIGFGWVEPYAGADYVVVTHDDHAEAYAVLGSLPVRVSTERVDVATSSARFEISEHTDSGRQLRAYVLQPQVAG
jgi:hypothetical protein